MKQQRCGLKGIDSVFMHMGMESISVDSVKVSQRAANVPFAACDVRRATKGVMGGRTPLMTPVLFRGARATHGVSRAFFMIRKGRICPMRL